ncbi:hypothetical protein [Jannaschia sp. LMIT008]|uniref:hypothetical protein n=1 Tax=Jannaschia maritima TaxID=3032585 RepID=UPI002811ECE9|nr:hypothetical protein [Jannaschia sp. LMIT008]
MAKTPDLSAAITPTPKRKLSATKTTKAPPRAASTSTESTSIETAKKPVEAKAGGLNRPGGKRMSITFNLDDAKRLRIAAMDAGEPVSTLVERWALEGLERFEGKR